MFYIKYLAMKYLETNWGKDKQKYLIISFLLHSILSCTGEDTYKLWVLGPGKYSPQLFYTLSSEITMAAVSSINCFLLFSSIKENHLAKLDQELILISWEGLFPGYPNAVVSSSHPLCLSSGVCGHHGSWLSSILLVQME